MENQTTHKTGSQYKDTVFRTLFGDSKHFLELYNAVADEHIPADTIVTPYPSNELLAKYNDLAACIGDQLIVFFEHQSTISTNMPLRLLSYITDVLYLHIVDRDSLYKSKQVMIPTPKFYVLYNGEMKPNVRYVKLSDAFKTKDANPSMEIIAEIIDINLNSGESALHRSTALQGYSYFIEEIRKNQKAGMIRDKAIVTAIDSCIEQDVLSGFLTENYQEVSRMLNWEYDPEVEKRVLREEALEEGHEIGKEEGLQEGLQQGLQEGLLQGAELLAKLIREGYTLDEALEFVKTEPSTPPQ